MKTSNGWTPVKDEKPNLYTPVFVTIRVDGEDGYEYYTDAAMFGTFDSWETFIDWDCGKPYEVVSWMKMPEPCRG